VHVIPKGVDAALLPCSFEGCTNRERVRFTKDARALCGLHRFAEFVTRNAQRARTRLAVERQRERAKPSEPSTLRPALRDALDRQAKR
jgi:hypothetical protein